MKNKRCPNYVGLACVSGICPIALREEYEERCIPGIQKCRYCFYYEGCKDCALYGTEYCDQEGEYL